MPDDVPETPRGASRRRPKTAPKANTESTACAAGATDPAPRQQTIQASLLLWRVRKELRRLQRCGDWQAAEQLREVVAPLLGEQAFLVGTKKAEDSP